MNVFKLLHLLLWALLMLVTLLFLHLHKEVSVNESKMIINPEKNLPIHAAILLKILVYVIYELESLFLSQNLLEYEEFVLLLSA